jgi:hypothetical protein
MVQDALWLWTHNRALEWWNFFLRSAPQGNLARLGRTPILLFPLPRSLEKLNPATARPDRLVERRIFSWILSLFLQVTTKAAIDAGAPVSQFSHTSKIREGMGSSYSFLWSFPSVMQDQSAPCFFSLAVAMDLHQAYFRKWFFGAALCPSWMFVVKWALMNTNIERASSPVSLLRCLRAELSMWSDSPSAVELRAGAT